MLIASIGFRTAKAGKPLYIKPFSIFMQNSRGTVSNSVNLCTPSTPTYYIVLLIKK